MFRKSILDSLEALRQSWCRQQQQKMANQRKRRNRVRLGEDMGLEDRFLLAGLTLLWDPPQPALDSNFSTAGNWKDEMTGNRAVNPPGSQDTAKFTGNNTANCTIDVVAQNTLGGLVIQVGYTGTVTLETDLTVTTTEQYDGTITSATYERYTIPSGGTYIMAGGTQSGQSEGGDPYASTIISGNATMTVAGADATLDSRRVTNYGTLNWGATQDLIIKDDAKIDNLNGSVFNITIQNDTADLRTAGTNNGLITVDAGSSLNVSTNNTLEISVPLSVSGTVSVTGTVDFYSTAAFSGGSLSGNAGTFVLSGGEINVAAGTTTTASVATFFFGDVNGAGTISGNGTFVFDGSDFWWGTDSTMSGSGTTRFNLNRTVYIGGRIYIDQRAVQNSGTVKWTAGNIVFYDGATFTNNGIFDAHNGTYDILSDSTATRFVNNGTFKKTDAADDGETQIFPVFTQQGTIEVKAGWFVFEHDVDQTAGQTIFNGGFIQVYGDFTIEAGTSVTVGQDVHHAAFWADGVYNYGTIDLRNNTSTYLKIKDRAGDVTGGNGYYFQSGTGSTLSMNLVSDTDNDWLRVYGHMTISGDTLNVGLTGNYRPSRTLTWTLVQADTTGDPYFETVNKPGPDPTKYTFYPDSPSFKIDYTPRAAAANDAFNGHKGQLLNVAAPGVLANDTGDGPLTAVLIDTTTNGVLTLNSDGSFSYTPNTGFLGTDYFSYQAYDGTDYSNTATVSIDVLPNQTQVALVSSLNPSYYTQDVTFTATVTPVDTPATGPTGLVDFYSDGVLLNSAQLVNGQASITINTLDVGQHNINAVYEGDDIFEASTSDPFMQTVQANQVDVSLTSSVNPAVVGQQVTFTVTVTPSGGTPFTNPTGWIDFYSDGVFLGSAQLVDGTATFDTSDLDVGDHAITAYFEGDGIFEDAWSDPFEEDVVSG